MEIPNEVVLAIRHEIGLMRLAETQYPETPIGKLHDCACLGPMPECLCMKRKRLIDEFMDKTMPMAVFGQKPA